jgi:hypothetical protein
MVFFRNFGLSRNYVGLQPTNNILSRAVIILIFLFGIVGGGVQLDPLGTSATNWPIVPVPGDYEAGEFVGMMIGRGNRSTRRKPAPVPLCPPQIPNDLTGREPGPPQW